MAKIFKNFLTKLGENTLDISALESLGHDMTTGSNANGTWIRWGNGLQVCYFRDTLRNDTVEIGGYSLFDLTFPNSFSGSSSYVVIGEATLTMNSGSVLIGTNKYFQNSTATKAIMVATNGSSTKVTQIRNLQYIAIGFWK